MERQRYYSKKSYEAPMSIFGTGIVFMIVGIISLVFNSLQFDFIGLRYWGYWLFIPAFFIFIGGFTQIYTNQNFKKAVRVVYNTRFTEENLEERTESTSRNWD